MATTDTSTIADVYARSLLELAAAQGETQTIDQELSEFVAFLKIETDFRDFFESPVVDVATRGSSLDRMFQGRMSDLLLNTLHVMNRKGRTTLVIPMQVRYHKLVIAQQGIVEVTVRSASPLDAAGRAQLIEVLSRRTGQRAQLVERVDPALIGGLIVTIGNEQIDLSISRQLERVHDTVLHHAARHIHRGTARFVGGE